MRYVAFATVNYPDDKENTKEFTGNKQEITSWIYDLIQIDGATSFVVTIAPKMEG